MARIEVTADEFPGMALQGSGTDTLVLVGGGTFDFAYVTFAGFSEIVSEPGTGSYLSVTVKISGEQLSGVNSISSANSSAYNIIHLTGNSVDLRNKTFSNFDSINIADDNAVVTVNSMSQALTLNAWERQGETVVLDGPVLTPTSRTALHNRGFDHIQEGIQEGSVVWTDATPTLTGLTGSFHVRAGESVSLDPEHDALVSDQEGLIATLDISLSGNGYYFAMNNFRVGQNFTIVDNSYDQTLMYKGSEIARIDRLYYSEDGARILFNQPTTPEIITEFIRNLSYAPGDFIYEKNVTVTFTAYDPGNRKAEAVLHVTAEQNWTPTKPDLNGTSVAENAVAGAVVGILGATDGNGDPVSYRLTDDAGGRFSIDGNKLVVSGRIPLDFEQASTHTVTVVASDGQKEGLPATFTISITDVIENTVPGTDGTTRIPGTAGKDKLVGTEGQDILYGGSGNDTLTGSGNKDVFVFNAKLGTSKTDRKVNFDTITDFKVGEDKLWLDNAIFKKLGKGTEAAPGALNKKSFVVGDKAKDKDDYLIYNKKTGVLSYDADGSGKGQAIEFAQLKKGLMLTYKDLFVI